MSYIQRWFALLASSGLMALAGCGDASLSGTATSARAGGTGSSGGGGRAWGPGGSGDAEAEPAACDALSARLQAALDDAAGAEGLPGIAAAVDLGECHFRGAS